jgi:hypothetical protein
MLEVSKMKKRFIIFYVAAFCIVAGLFFAMPVSSAILFYEDFEDAQKISDDWDRDGFDGSAGLTTEQIRYGSKSYKFSLTRYDSGDFREELVLRAPFNPANNSIFFTIGHEYWIGFSFFLADGFHSQVSGGSYIMHHQYHGVPDSPPTCDPKEDYRNPVVTIQTSYDELRNAIRADSRQRTPRGDYQKCASYNYGPPLIGQWIDFVINIKWSYGADGFLKTWKNGELVTNDTGGNCFNDVKGPYMKIGIYAFLDQDQTITIYYDELRIGDNNSSYSEVAPGGSVKPLPPTNVEAKITSDLTE